MIKQQKVPHMAEPRKYAPSMRIDTFESITMTMELSTAEFGAYNLIRFNSWINQSPVHKDILPRITKTSLKEWAQMEGSLSRYFSIEGDWWSDTEVVRQLNSKKTRKSKRARISGLLWSEIRKYIFSRDDFTCRYCNKRTLTPHCDHIVPICKGGSNHESNLTTSCRSCNLSKGSKTLQDWLGERA